MVMTIHTIKKFLTLMVLLLASHVCAQESESLLNFKFNHLSNFQNADYFSLVDTDMEIASTPSLLNNQAVIFSQYDATWTYPWETQNMNLDLGLTLRHLSGIKNSGVHNRRNSLDNTHFQQVLPLLHASALFNLPLQGLTAGFEGSHLDSAESQIFDYRAKVSYEWRKGFGMQGGWQHQQFSLDKALESGTDYKRNGPFIDLYLNF